MSIRAWAFGTLAVATAALLWLPGSAAGQPTASNKGGTTSEPVPACQPKQLRPEVLHLLRPLMEARIKQAEERQLDGGTRRRTSGYADEVDAHLHVLLKDRTPEGDEALAYLLSIYLGDHSGGELVCAVVKRGLRMLALVKANRECQPLTGLEPFPRGVRSSGLTAKYALDYLASGEPCLEE